VSTAIRDTLEAQRAAFARDGFLVMPDVLSPDECDALVRVMARLDRDTGFNTRRRPRRPGDLLELHNCVARAPEFLELVDRPDVLEVLCSLIGYNIQLGASHCFIRPSFPETVPLIDQSGFEWHHDLGPTALAVNGRLPHLATRVGYFFTPLDRPSMGSISVVPGSHRSAGPPAWNTETGQPYGAMELLVAAGTAVVFDNRLWHSPAPNYSDRSRMNLYMEYCPRWVRPFDYYTYGEELLAGASPVRRQLLGYDFSDIYDGDLGYQQPTESDTPLKGWLADRGLGDIPLMMPEP
jgi:ectoine hydroxylase-related dioxygenase (phytanoyl-CoA dioxygenase family)